MRKASAEIFATAGERFLGRSYSEMDCQAFVEHTMKIVGIDENLAGSNAWYREMTWTGTPEECKEKFGTIPAGALLFILEQDGGEPIKYKTDGIGNAGHIGIVTGHTPGAIHSSSSKGCVCESNFEGKTIRNGGWNRIGLWNRFDYGFDLEDGKEKQEEQQMKVYEAAHVTGPEGETVFLRKGPSKSEAWIERVPVGSQVTVLIDEGMWVFIEWCGKQGYMNSNYIEYDNTGSDVAAGLNEEQQEKLNEVFDMIRRGKQLLDDAEEALGMLFGRG